MLNFWQKAAIFTLLLLTISVVFQPIASAQWITSEAVSIPSTFKLILDRVWQWLQIALLTGWKNGLNYFLAKWAKDEATRLASSGKGQQTNFAKHPGQSLNESLSAAYGDVLNDLAKGTLGIDLCSLGDPNFAATLFITINQGTVPPPPSCTWAKIKAEAARFKDKLDKNKKFSDWAKINLEVQYAASGGIGLEDDKAVDAGCKQFDGPTACGDAHGTSLKKDCIWYGNQCRSKKQAENLFCKYADDGLSALANKDNCTVAQKKNGLFRADELELFKDVNCKWSAEYGSAVRKEIAASTTVAQSQAGIKALNAGSCIPDINVFEAFGQQFSASGGGSDIDAAIKTSNKAVQKGAKSVFDAIKDFEFGGQTSGKKGLISLDSLTPREPSQAQTQMLQQGMVNNMMSDSGSAIVNAANIFLGTYIQKWLQNQLNKSPDPEDNDPSNIGNPQVQAGGGGESRLRRVQETVEKWEKPKMLNSLQENLSQYLMKCTEGQAGATSIGEYNCTITSDLALALDQGISLRKAVAPGGPLAGLEDQPFGGDFVFNPQSPSLSLRNIMILRSLQVVPVGWEIAALYAKNFAANNMPLANFPGATLRYLALGTPPGQAASSYDKGCFEDPKHPDDPTLPVGCRNNDGKNPWWHLVDPDWVLKLPPTKCAFGGSGAEVLTVMDVCSQDNVPGTTVGGVPTNAPTCDEVEGVVNPDFKVSVVSRNDQYCADRQDCLKIDSHGKCVAYGYCYEQKPVWRFGGDSCSEQAASCANLTRTADGKSFSYLTNTLRSCSKPGCTWLATSQLPSAAWLVGADNPKIFLTLNGTKGVERCSRSGVGCTRLISQEAGINVVVDGDFTQSDWGSYWQAVSNEPCSFANHFSVENQQIEGLEVNGPNSYCTVKTKGQIPIVPNGIYLARLFIQASADAQAQVDFKKADGSVLRTINMNVSAGQVNQVTSTIIFTVDNPDGAPILLQPEISVKANNATATIQAFELVKVDTQTTEFIDNTYSSDYREATDFDAYYKVAADNLDCNRYNDILYNYNTEAACAAANKVWRADWQSCVAGGSDQCLNYLPFCKASDLGCLGYKSVSGGPEVPAKVSQNDFCPNSCVGLALFQRKTTVFEQQEDQSHSAIYPVGASFIPQTAQMCQPRAAGCEEFTNLDQVAAGGEGREYYTFLRQCVQPDNQRVRYYYTWEGSDTAGFQLKRWRLLATSHDDSPCTDIRPGEIYCSGPENPASSTGACTVDDLANPNPNPDCRDFFDLANNHYYRLQTRIVTASADCHPYRRTISNQTYNAIPSEGVRCQVNENGCREYLGNQGNSIRTIFNEDFEDPAKVPANWGPGNSVVISNIAVQPGGHSVLVGGSYVEIKIPSSSLQLGRRYIMTSWAKLVDNGGREAPRNLSASLDFTLYNLTTDWQLYRSDVVTSTLSDYAQVRIYINSLPDGKRALLDNVVLQELPDNFYVIENSWVTPAECTPNYENCRQYQVSSGELVALTGFSRICSAQSKGCQAFIDTRNSKLQSSATYSQGEGVNDITIPNDRLLYLVLQSNKACSANEKACQAFGLPQVNLANPLVGTTNVDTVYFKNDPDKYNQGSSPILCTNQELFCSAFSGKAYFDPAPKQATSSSFKVCSWQNDKWQKLDGSGECPTASMSPNNVAVNPNNENYLLSPDQPGFSGWAASCSPSDNLCKEYRDPEQPNSDRLPLCRSDIGSNTYGICSLAANSNNGEWCFKDSQRVCWVNTGSHDCTYNNLWYCAGAGAENGDCHLNWYGQDIVPCQYTGLANNERWCQFDVSCRSYYQKSVNTDCSNPGVVDRGQGCRLFNDTSDPSLIYNATSSLDGFAPVTVSDTGLPAQANKLVKVEPDRQCSEGLYCKSSISLDKGGKTSQICLSLGACKKFNDKGECAETVVHTADSMNIDLNSPLGSASALPWSKVTRFQTGYKYPNVAWSNTQKIVGNYLPDLMTQTAKGKIGQQFENNSFEKTNTSTVTVVTNNGDAAYTRDHGWVYVVVNPFGDVDQPSSCAFTKERISEVNPSDKALPLMLASNYAVKIELTSNTSSDCRLAQNLDNISNKTGYTITFWAKAGSSGLIMKSGVGFNDGQGLREDIAFVATSWILTKDWQKYTLVIPAAKVPVRTRALRLVVQTPWLVKGAGTVWVDEILIQPSLRVGQDLVEGAPGAASE
ncbi:MAG: hypothetical protein NTV81_03015 [Candidatus Komeilibacteria bacterium]|nr:hypothetical protein [Candidatus Komeilibacteria bacterium]